MHSFTNLLTLTLFAAIPLVSAHGMITFATGDQGGTGIGLGVTSTTSDSENDVTVFRGSGAFGKTGGSGTIDPATDLAAAEDVAGTTLPQVSSGGTLNMTFHQINQDGAGPISCQVSADGTGADFAAMDVTTDVPGEFGLSLTKDTDFPLVAQMPAGVACTGTVGSATNACVVQCMNPVGPFGSNMVVQMAGAATGGTAAAAGNTTAAAAGNSTAVAADTTAATTGDTTGDATTTTGRKHHLGFGIKRVLRFARDLDVAVA